MQAKPGKFLSGLILGFGIAISFASFILIFRPDIGRRLGYFPNWFNLYLIMLLIARLTALFAIWNLKRWGVYALFMLECIEVVMGMSVFTSVLSLPLRLSIGIPALLALLAIWYLALRSKWQAFT